MDFNKPLRRLEGFVIYTTLLDFIDTFVHTYNEQKEGKEFPSLRIATDMILTLLEDFKNIEIADLNQQEKNVDISELLEKLGDRLSEYRKQVNDTVLDSREMGLFMDEKPTQAEKNLLGKVLRAARASSMPLDPLVIEKKEDIDWLSSVGITHTTKELSLPKKKRNTKKNASE